jgi:tubulin polyglutamylase TTLL6/13
LLGYHHVRQWDLLWTKSVYAIKAARQLQPGQVVSAIAGLNCLTMKKRMVQTLRMVSDV